LIRASPKIRQSVHLLHDPLERGEEVELTLVSELGQ
jgi:hypothetical protein